MPWSFFHGGINDDEGYVRGSYFAIFCGKNRLKHLKELHEAKDPYIRVAGAVYLCFEDEPIGIARLKELTTLEGDPGVWAALTLARRGYRDAVPRVLEIFSTPGETNMHRNLRMRILVLLSNSARTSGVSQPPREGIPSWWKKNGPSIILHDPLLKLLEGQKID